MHDEEPTALAETEPLPVPVWLEEADRLLDAFDRAWLQAQLAAHPAAFDRPHVPTAETVEAMFAEPETGGPAAVATYAELERSLLRSLALLAALNDAQGPCLPVASRPLRLLGHMDVLVRGMLTRASAPFSQAGLDSL